MKRIIILYAVVILAGWSFTACGASTQGPTTWMDRPLDGTHFPMGAIKIQAHASDANGVASIEFYVSENQLASIPAGGVRLAQAGIDWMPPGPGSYTLIARAVDTRGNSGPQANVLIVVDDLVVTITPTPAPGKIITPSSLPSGQGITATPASSGPSLLFKQNANCRTGPGTAYDNVDTMFQGQTVPIEGRNEQSTWFMVKKSSGHGDCWVSIISVEVRGSSEAVPVVAVAAIDPAAPPAQPPVQAPPGQAQDTTPPVISNVSIGPTSVQKAGCGSPNTFTIRATVTDASGVGNVTYELKGPGPQDGGDGFLNPAGGNSYQAAVGPIAGSTGSWSVSLSAVDMSNNHAYAGPWTIQVMCIQ
jgi:hypothetical protein